VLAGLLALSTFWAIWDMIRERAPWQRYQMALNEQETAAVEGQIQTASAEFEAQKASQYNTLVQQLQEAQSMLEGESYQAMLSELNRADEQIQDSMQEYRFAKSEYDALWYEYKNAEHHHDEAKMKTYRPQADALDEHVQELKGEWDKAAEVKADIESRLARYRSDADSLQAAIDALLKPITDLEARLGRIGDRQIKIEQFVLGDFVRGNFESYLDQVDRCTSCHVNTDKGGYDDYQAPFHTHPNRDVVLKTHPISRFGCTPCHEGQGEALRLPHAHGEVAFWEHPLLDGEWLEAGCNKCHKAEMKVEHAPKLTRAKRMVFDLGCYGCHDIAGYENARKIGPPLNALTSKTTDEFVYRWVSDTKSFREHTRMPNPEFVHEEALAVTAYLHQIGEKSDYEPPMAPMGGSVQRGKNLVESVGCKGCHIVTPEDREIRVTDVTYDIAPDLSRIGSKVNRDWLYAWIRNPKQYHPESTMPDLRLTDAEALDVTAYLMTLKEENPPAPELANIDLSSAELFEEGKSVIRNFGCHGCHEISGMENEGKVSVTLNEFGGKTHDELFFGDAHAKGEVPDETWDAWTIGKMKNSRAYATEAVIQRMPNFAMSDADAQTIAMLLKSWDSRRISTDFVHDRGDFGVALEKGRRLVRKYNCIGCHIIEGEGGFIRPTVTKTLENQGGNPDDAESFSPPNLIGEGRKVQPDWLFQFLKSPETQIRPWLQVRMPTFGLNDDEVNDIIAYFQALENMDRPFMEIDIELTKSEQMGAEKLFSTDYLSCFSCHQVGDKKPEGPPSGWAPDFLLAPNRLNPDWVYDWIANPQALQPGTRMPAFYPDANPPDIFDGDAHQQIEALRDYLMNIDKFVDRL
jgi:mono/diheme cytochrome c family protein